jgi:phage baseplate assembly protein W|tara:strand:+ start:4328 stop:4747 length:420 start_codon:yes stop_codon:yes gene_type:complete
MALQLNEPGRTININPLDADENVAIGVTFPFNGNAVFNSSFSTKEQVKSNLLNVLLTDPGERIMEPTFGVGVKRLLFEQNINEEDLKDRVNNQTLIYVPEIEITNLTTKFIADDHTLFIRITYKFILDETLDAIQLNFK